MKKFLFHTMLLCAAVVLFTACDKKGKGDDDDQPKNTVSLAGEDYVIAGGMIGYYGNYYSNDSENVYLYLSNEDETAEIYLDLIVADGSKTLTPGKYNVGSGYEPLTIVTEEGDSTVNNTDITGGSITVTKSGDVFTITFNLVTTAGNLTGKCSLELEWVDETEGEDYDSSLSGTVSVGGFNVAASAGGMQYYGLSDSEQSVNVDLEIVNDDRTSGLVLEMYVPKVNDRLVAGTYTFNDNQQPFTVYVGSAVKNGDESDITGGTVTVAVSGETYTITFNLTSDAGAVTGTVTGTLDWENGVGGLGR